MDKELETFLAEGMKRYKKAANVMVTFGKEIEKQLREVLDNQKAKGWGKFHPKKDVIAKSTHYWSEYPLLNAKLDGEIKGESVRVYIAVNWYQSEIDYPFYAAWFEPREPYVVSMEQFEWKPEFEFDMEKLIFYPKPNHFNLKKDFKTLLGELVRFLSEA